MNPARAGVTVAIRGVRIEEIDSSAMREIRILDKRVDELAKGRPMEKVLRGRGKAVAARSLGRARGLLKAQTFVIRCD